MKKLFSTTLVVIFMLSAIGVQAQFKIGAKGGLSLSRYTTDNLLKDDMAFKTGYDFGTMLDIKIIPFIRFQPEFMYFQKGVKYKYDILGVENVGKSTINYLHFPMNLKVNIPIIPVYLIAGPYMSYALSGETSRKAGSLDAVVTSVDFDFESTKPLDFGFNFGTGLEKEFMNLLTFFVEARFDVGVMNINGFDNLSDKNMNIGFNAGVLLGF